MSIPPKIKSMNRIKKLAVTAATIGSIGILGASTIVAGATAGLYEGGQRNLTDIKREAIVEYLEGGNKLGELSPRLREDVGDTVQNEILKTEGSSKGAGLKVTPVISSGRLMTTVGFHNDEAEAENDVKVDEYIDSKTAVGETGPEFEELVSKVDEINSEIDKLEDKEDTAFLGAIGGWTVGGAGLAATSLINRKIEDSNAEEDLDMEQ